KLPDVATASTIGEPLTSIPVRVSNPPVPPSIARCLCSLERRAAAAAMTVAAFAAGAVRDFVERADYERWLQPLTIKRKAENPGLAAIQAILGWVAADA